MSIKSYKGMDKDMKCYGGFQYEPGGIYETDHAVRCGGPGLHSCEAPLDVLRYFKLNRENRYFETEAAGDISRDENGDSKIASSRLTIGAEIGLPGIIKAHFEYTRKKAESGTTGGDDSNLAGGFHSNLAGGNYSNLAGGDDSNLAGGNYSNLAGGNYSNLAGGFYSAILGRNGCKAKAGLRSIICLSEWAEDPNGDYVPMVVKAAIVDGETIKPDTWYTLRDGEFVEVEEDAND